MATVILRPTADQSLAHTCSSGSSGYALIDDTSADGDSTYIYQAISGTSSASTTSIFKVSGTSVGKIKIKSVALTINAKTTKGNSNDTATLAYNLYFNGVEGTSGSGTLSTSYGDLTKTYNASDFGLAGTIFDNFDAANLVVHIQTIGKKNASKNDDFQNRVTQMYLTVTYEEVTDPVYTCAAAAGAGVASATVSQTSVISGNSCTFTATLLSNYNLFDGWYSDSGCTNLVSPANPYTAAITADTTLYAKASRSQFSMSVGEAEHGIASVSAASVLYGDTVAFTFTPESADYELYGWYADAGFAEQVSEENPYTFTATASMTLYPKVGLKRYTITLTSPGTFINNSASTLSIIAADTNQLTKADMRNLRAGAFSSIASEKVIASDTLTKTYATTYSVSIRAPLGSTVALHALVQSALVTYMTTYFLKDDTRVTNGPHLVITATEDATYTTYASSSLPVKCVCSAIACAGVEYAEAYPETVAQEYTTTFSADMLSGYKFQGWYSDDACTTLVSTDNPYIATAPKYTTERESATNLILYAKAQKSGEGTGVYVKAGGAYAEAQAVYRRVSGAWVLQDDGGKAALQSGKYRVSNT